MNEKTPFIGFSGEKLSKLPEVKIGNTIECTKCGEDHILEGADDGSELLLFYRCGGKSYLGAINGRAVVGVKSDVSGEI